MIPWVLRLTRFTHDWMKNGYLWTLRRATRVLEGAVEDPAFEEWFWPAVREWGGRRGEVAELLETFVPAMSPRALFATGRMARIRQECREWLPEVLEMLWRNRVEVDEILGEGGRCLRKVDAAYEALIRKAAGAVDVEEARVEVRGELADLLRACQGLTEALGRFPRSTGVL